MIEELVIPQCMQVLARMTSRHLRKNGGRSLPERVLPAGLAPQVVPASGFVVFESLPLTIEPESRVFAAELCQVSIEPALPAVPGVSVALIAAEREDPDQLTENFLAAARMMGIRDPESPRLVKGILLSTGETNPVYEAAADETLDRVLPVVEADPHVNEIESENRTEPVATPRPHAELESAAVLGTAREAMVQANEQVPESADAVHLADAVHQSVGLVTEIAENVPETREANTEPPVAVVSLVQDSLAVVVPPADASPPAADFEAPPVLAPTPPVDLEAAVAVVVAAPAANDIRQSAEVAAKSAASTVLAPAVKDEYNRNGLEYRRPMPRPKARGLVIDFHCHLLARRHAEDWFEAADHYGMDVFLTMSPLEEAVALARDWGHRLRFNAVPQWGDTSPSWPDHWLTRIEAFYNLGSRIAKFHASPGTMLMRGARLDSPMYKPLFAEVKSRGMAIMTHVGDPDTWYHGKYSDAAKFGSRDDHYRMWESLLEEYRGTTWVGAHMGGNPEDLPRLQRLLDTFPDLILDCSATRWMVREISARRDPAREFFIRNQDRILFGSDQVSGDDRHFDFLASRIWCHRKLWETAYSGESPIIDPDVPKDQQPTLRGLALPDIVLQKIYHDNAARLLNRLGMGFEG